jgi:integrase
MLKRIREQERRLYMTSDEVVRFFDAVDSLTTAARNRQHREGYHKFKLFCEVLLSTGMRRSELLNLKQNHVDLENNIIRVEQAKGRKRREIPMAGKVREIMMELSPGLFHNMTKDQVTHKFTDCARGIGLKGMELHSLRHTFGTYLIAMGYDIMVAKDLLGHEDIKTTMLYAKADTRLIRDAIRSFDVLERSGDKMVTKGGSGTLRLLKRNSAGVTDESPSI